MKVLITGGAGFIGSHIVDAAISNGHEVFIIDDLSTGKYKNVSQSARFYKIDIRNTSKVKDIFKFFKPDVVCHQAAQASVVTSTNDPKLDADINILGSLNIIDASIKHNVKKFIFASTGGAIYGEVNENQLANEQTTPNPLSPYAISKLTIENYLKCLTRHSDMQYHVLRYANVYGPRQDPHGEAGVVSIFSSNLILDLPIKLNARTTVGDEGCIRDYVYVEDVVRANIKTIESNINEPIINICTGISTSTTELLNKLESNIKYSYDVSYQPKRIGDVQRSVLDPTLCTKLFGNPTDINIGLSKTALWFKDECRL